MTLITNGSTPVIAFLMVATSDHIAGLASITPTVRISKNGGTSAATTNAASAIDNTNMAGWYVVTLTATETNTNGEITFHATGTGADPSDWKEQVVAFSVTDAVRLGLTALPNAAAEAAGGLYTRGAGAGQINQNASGQVDTRWVAGNVTVGTNNDKTGYTASTVGTGAITSGSFAAGAIDAGAIATDAIGSAELATSAVSEITAAVVDQALAGHTTAGTVGGALNSASSAGDPWNTALPGAYAGGTAGNIVGNRVDAAISSRMATFTLPTNFSSLAIDVSGRVTVGAIVNGAIAAATFAANALDAVWSTVTRTITGGTVTTNSDKTGYSLANGSIVAATFAAGAIDANAIATDAIGSAELAASAVTEIAAGVSVGSAPTAAQNAAAVWDLAISGHTTGGTFGAKVNGLSGASGSGAIDVTVSVTSGGNPVDGALVWITTDSAGANTVASNTTITNGTCHVFLDSGTYYSWAQRGGINFLEGASFTV